MSPESGILHGVEQYYTGKLRAHGTTSQGVDWKSTESQYLRFEQLLKLCNRNTGLSLNDYGCGYGALAGYMMSRFSNFTYCGFDISEEMIAAAQGIHQESHVCTFVSLEQLLGPADYTVASGIFNVRLKAPSDEWRGYMLQTIHKIARLSRKGFAFNALTSYSDVDRMRADLYYADPCFFFDYCKRTFSKDVALLHDYGLYEFTMLVKN